MDAALAFLESLQGFPAYATMFGLLVLCGVGFPINEDIVLLVSAALTLNGVMQPVPMILVAWTGLLIGDGLIFHWGHRYGARLLSTALFARMIAPQRLAAFQERIRRRGPFYIFVIRFLPGIRTPLFFAAGSLKLPYRYLFIYDGLAAAIHVPVLVYSVRYVGGHWESILEQVQRFQLYILGAILLALAFWLVRRWWQPAQKEKHP